MTPGNPTSLREFIDGVSAYQRTITVFAPRRDAALESYFETRNVAVEHEPLPDDGSGGFVVVTADGEFVGSVGARAVRELISPSDPSLELGPNESIRVPLNLLADTTFVSFDRRQMLAASREFEDRAYRQGRGTLRAGFQSLSKLKSQRDVYEMLTEETSLDVHLYGKPDWSPELQSATVHVEDAPEIGSCWFLVFDGGGDDRQACALLAEEIESDPGTFRGFWTYDAETVFALDDYLCQTYG